MRAEQIEEALNFDALSHAEKLTGRSYKSDHDTEQLGLGLHLAHGERKRDLLRSAGDTYWAQPMLEWIGVVEALGFELVHVEPIPTTQDVFRIWWRDDGLLLKADSYWGDKSVNSANVHFNYCGPRGAMHQCSNGFAGEVAGEAVWRGNRDAREGLRFALDRMQSQGRFVNPWLEQGFLWLLHYMDTKQEDYDYRAITAARLAKLPERVRAAIPAIPV